jgi:hypothetical protein
MFASLLSGVRVLNAKPSPTAGSFGGQRSPAKFLFGVTKTMHRKQTSKPSRTADGGPVAPASAENPVPTATVRCRVPDASDRGQVRSRQRVPGSIDLFVQLAGASTTYGRRPEPQTLMRNRCRQQPSGSPRAAGPASGRGFNRCPFVQNLGGRQRQTQRRGVQRGHPACTPFDEYRSAEGAEADPVPSTATDPAPMHSASVRSSRSDQRQVPVRTTHGQVWQSLLANSSRVPGAHNSQRDQGADDSPVPVQTVRSPVLERCPRWPGAGSRLTGSGSDQKLATFIGPQRRQAPSDVAEACRWPACGEGRFETGVHAGCPFEVPTTAPKRGASSYLQSGCPFLPGALDRQMSRCRQAPPISVPLATHFPGALSGLYLRCR